MNSVRLFRGFPGHPWQPLSLSKLSFAFSTVHLSFRCPRRDGTLSSACVLCVFLVCFQQVVGQSGWPGIFLVPGGPCCTVFSFRWFVRSNGFSANLFIQAFIPSVPGICFQLATFSPSPAQRKKEMHRTKVRTDYLDHNDLLKGHFIL